MLSAFIFRLMGRTRRTIDSPPSGPDLCRGQAAGTAGRDRAGGHVGEGPARADRRRLRKAIYSARTDNELAAVPVDGRPAGPTVVGAVARQNSDSAAHTRTAYAKLDLHKSIPRGSRSNSNNNTDTG